MRNATKMEKVETEARSQDIDEHLQRFVSEQYAEKYFAIINFDMKGMFVLPRDATYHEQVHTYHHINNSLYRGNMRIKSPVVHKDTPIRKCSTRILRKRQSLIHHIVQFCTIQKRILVLLNAVLFLSRCHLQ